MRKIYKKCSHYSHIGANYGSSECHKVVVFSYYFRDDLIEISRAMLFSSFYGCVADLMA